MTRVLEKKPLDDTPEKVLGQLVISDAKSSYEKLNDPEFLRDSMVKAAKAGGLNILDIDVHRFEPHGVSAILVLMESHFSVHTWPEHGHFSVDIFSCGNEGDASKAMDEFLKLMESDIKEVKKFERGVLRKTE
jgi:S-adenosylmethionine decarboxylase proenzyme